MSAETLAPTIAMPQTATAKTPQKVTSFAWNWSLAFAKSKNPAKPLESQSLQVVYHRGDVMDSQHVADIKYGEISSGKRGGHGGIVVDHSGGGRRHPHAVGDAQGSASGRRLADHRPCGARGVGGRVDRRRAWSPAPGHQRCRDTVGRHLPASAVLRADRAEGHGHAASHGAAAVAKAPRAMSRSSTATTRCCRGADFKLVTDRLDAGMDAAILGFDPGRPDRLWPLHHRWRAAAGDPRAQGRLARRSARSGSATPASWRSARDVFAGADRPGRQRERAGRVLRRPISSSSPTPRATRSATPWRPSAT